MKLIIGLGNIGQKYEYTRHNVGFFIVDMMAQKWSLKFNQNKFNGIFAKESNFILAKPYTFMNLSGDFVQKIAHYWKIQPQDILVICDDIDLEPGRMIMQRNVAHNGQKGIMDIINKLGTKDFYKIKIGIGRDENISNHVLSKMSKTEINNIKNKSDILDKTIQYFLDNKPDLSIQTINRSRKQEI